MAIDPNLVTTVEVSELPSSLPLLTSLMAHETAVDGLLKKMTIQQLVDLIAPLVTAIQFQVITLHVSQQYITDNFNGTGLGINLMVGYAIVNGSNGTVNKDGRVGIAYGATYSAVGALGGSKDAVLVTHNHLNGVANEQVGTFVYGASTIDMPGAAIFSVAEDNGARTYQGQTNEEGVSGSGKNMQPYLVELQVMKL